MRSYSVQNLRVLIARQQHFQCAALREQVKASYSSYNIRKTLLNSLVESIVQTIRVRQQKLMKNVKHQLICEQSFIQNIVLDS